MRKLLFLALVFITSHAFAQEAPPGMPNLHFIVAVQIGTDTLKNGLDTVRLTDETVMEMSSAMADSNYIVTLTPMGNCGSLNLLKINAAYFIVKEQGNASGMQLFDYVVIANQKRPMMPVHSRIRGQRQPPEGQQ